MSSSKQIVILPLNAQGHLIPTITLAQKIATQYPNLTITIATTPLNADHIQSTLRTADAPPSLSQHSNIQLARLPFNSSDHGLPSQIENTDKLPFHQMLILIQALIQTLNHHFENLIKSLIEEGKGEPPMCVISDVCFGWAIEIAKKFKIPSITLSPAGAFGTAAFLSFWQNMPHRNCLVDSDEFTLPGLPEKYRFPVSYLLPFIRETDGNDEWSRFFQGQLSLSLGADGWLCNTVQEMEGMGMEILRKYTKLPVWAIGPLLPSTMICPNKPSSILNSKIYGSHGVQEYGVSPTKCIEWLDSKPQGSVIYISFGSQVTISTSHMMELAIGLEQSGHPFIWVIKSPLGFDMNEEFKSEWLPEKFEEKMKTSGQGLLIHNWAPQLEILSHKSTGAFLSHCGWNSVLESLSQGVPIIGWPMVAEQVYNMKYLVEEMGVCVELAKGLQCVLHWEDVKKSIDLVMNTSDGKGKEMVEELTEVVEKMRGANREGSFASKGSSIKAMDDFINTLLKREKMSLV